MENKLISICDLVNGLLKFNLPKDTIYVDLKIHTLRGIHTYKKDSNNLTRKFSPWSNELGPFLSLKRKMTQFIRGEEGAATFHVNRLYVQLHPIPNLNLEHGLGPQSLKEVQQQNCVYPIQTILLCVHC